MPSDLPNIVFIASSTNPIVGELLVTLLPDLKKMGYQTFCSENFDTIDNNVKYLKSQSELYESLKQESFKEHKVDLISNPSDHEEFFKLYFEAQKKDISENPLMLMMPGIKDLYQRIVEETVSSVTDHNAQDSFAVFLEKLQQEKMSFAKIDALKEPYPPYFTLLTDEKKGMSLFRHDEKEINKYCFIVLTDKETPKQVLDETSPLLNVIHTSQDKIEIKNSIINLIQRKLLQDNLILSIGNSIFNPSRDDASIDHEVKLHEQNPKVFKQKQHKRDF